MLFTAAHNLTRPSRKSMVRILNELFKGLKSSFKIQIVQNAFGRARLGAVKTYLQSLRK